MLNPASKPRVLFVTPVLQHPAMGGPALRIENSIKALARVSVLKVLFRGSPAEMGGREAIAFYRGLCDAFGYTRYDHNGRRLATLARRAAARLSGPALGGLLAPHTADGDLGVLLRQVRTWRPDVIWLGFGNISYPLLKTLKAQTRVPVVVDTDSVWSRYVLRGLPFAPDEAARARIQAEGDAKQVEERWGTALADLTTAVSEIDAAYYRQFVDDPQRVQVFSNVVDLASYRQKPPPPPGLPACYGLIAGTFWPGSPMEHAARWFIDEVLPLVARTHPDFHLVVLGKDSDRVLADVHHDRVHVRGRVASVVPYLAHAAASLVPLWFESGTRFKILEAGACGVPVVSTHLGAEGIPVRDGRDLCLADTPADFAARIGRILDEPAFARSLGDHLKALVARSFSVETLVEQAAGLLQAVGEAEAAA